MLQGVCPTIFLFGLKSNRQVCDPQLFVTKMSTTEALLTKVSDAPPEDVEFVLSPDEKQNRLGRLLELARLLLDQIEQLSVSHSLGRLAQYSQQIHFNEPVSFYEAVEKFETELIRLTLSKTGGNQAQAARLLNLKSSTLHEIIKRYRIAV
jgi:transcriptional regulator with GAF, ATPase, and Fis domain